MTDTKTRLSVVYDDDTVVVHDERQIPVLCKDCRFSGWLRLYDYKESWPSRLPTHCLHYSGGVRPSNGTRVVYYSCTDKYDKPEGSEWRSRYPETLDKNHDGKCSDYVPAKKLPWWRRLFRSAKAMRE